MIAANEIFFTTEADAEEVAEILNDIEEITEWEIQEDTDSGKVSEQGIPEGGSALQDAGVSQILQSEGTEAEEAERDEAEPEETEPEEAEPEETERDEAKPEETQRERTGLEQMEPNGSILTVQAKIGTEDSRAVCRKLFFAFASREQALLELSSRKASLEDVFIELTESEVSEE